MGKNKKFVLSKEALDTHLNFLKEKDPSIIGKTCQMLSALKIITLPDHEAFLFVMGIIEDLKKGGRLNWLSEDQWSEFRLKTLAKYLPKILKERRWIFSIERYIKEKILNSITVEARRGRPRVPLFIEREDEDGNLEIIENPALKGKAYVDDTIAKIDLNEIFEKAKLTEREKNIYILKKTRESYTEELIAKILGVSRNIVKHDYKRAKDKLDKLVKAILRKRLKESEY